MLMLVLWVYFVLATGSLIAAMLLPKSYGRVALWVCIVAVMFIGGPACLWLWL